MQILNTVGGHDINIFDGATFDSSCRKYRGGQIVATVSYAGFMLSAKGRQQPAEPIDFSGVSIPTMTPTVWESVDEIPDDGNLYVVSAMFVAACRDLGKDTSRLLTINGTVVDESGRTIGCIGFSRN